MPSSRTMKIPILLVLLLLAAPGLAVEIYKWVDENGQTHYSTEKPQQNKSVNSLTVNDEYQPSAGTPAYLQRYMESGKIAKDKDGKVLQGKGEVMFFSTSWCGYCRKARHYFRKNNIAYKEYDIEKSTKARQMYDQYGGRGVPLLVFSGKRMQGFSASRFEKLYYSQP